MNPLLADTDYWNTPRYMRTPAMEAQFIRDLVFTGGPFLLLILGLILLYQALTHDYMQRADRNLCWLGGFGCAIGGAVILFCQYFA